MVTLCLEEEHLLLCGEHPFLYEERLGAQGETLCSSFLMTEVLGETLLGPQEGHWLTQVVLLLSTQHAEGQSDMLPTRFERPDGAEEHREGSSGRTECLDQQRPLTEELREVEKVMLEVRGVMLDGTDETL